MPLVFFWVFLGRHMGNYNSDIAAVARRWVDCHCMNENILLTSSVGLFVEDDIALWDGKPEPSLLAFIGSSIYWTRVNIDLCISSFGSY
jgi:hypothetical protein